MKIFNRDDLIINDATVEDWTMWSSVKPIKVAGKSDLNEITKLLDKETEYIEVKDYKSDKEFEYVIMFTDEGKYYFATYSGNVESEE